MTPFKWHSHPLKNKHYDYVQYARSCIRNISTERIKSYNKKWRITQYQNIVFEYVIRGSKNPYR